MKGRGGQSGTQATNEELIKEHPGAEMGDNLRFPVALGRPELDMILTVELVK